ncbi:hypothetical protein O0L34_g2474 [Tuta absoluta]|nr:hypothetical protein O0L34_g2474 [Tuta absoluta]
MLAASCLGLLGRRDTAHYLADRDKRLRTRASTMSTSETELIESTYMVTPTSTGGPAIKPNRESRAPRAVKTKPEDGDVPQRPGRRSELGGGTGARGAGYERVTDRS